jgi:RNA polymerase sigma-70 factor (ECF subfamily)
LPAEPTAPLVASTPELSTVYSAWFRSVYRWVKALGGPDADVEDLVQEVFLVVQRKLDTFDGRNLPGWLYGITSRIVRDHRRRAWFRHLFLRPQETALDDIEDRGQTSEERLQQRQEQRLFYRLVGRMNPKWQESFILFEVDGLSGEEIAALRGLPAATVRTHLHRARKQFLALVAEERQS